MYINPDEFRASSNERHQQLIHEANQQRYAATAGGEHVRRIMQWIGRRFVIWGHALQRHATVADPRSTPPTA